LDKEINDITVLSPSTRLPKKLAGTEEGRKIFTVLNSHLVSLLPGGDYLIPSFPMSQTIIDTLNSARRTGRLIRGLEEAEKKLAAERKGITGADLKTSSVRNERISRLVVIADDGSERFYRQTKKLVEQNNPRVLAMHLDATSFELGERIFGPGKRALFLLINHKDAVINFLTSLVKNH
jgi:ribosomal protein L7Ae-like RNA K-turn-binding protein